MKHPATYPTPILDAIANNIPAGSTVLDPMAGVGTIHELDADTYGIELESEWANNHPRTIAASILDGPMRWARLWTRDHPRSWWPDAFDVVAVSPPYGNRLADQYLPPPSDTSRRLTYATALGRKVSPGSSAGMQWGNQYRTFHRLAWANVTLHATGPGSRFILNCKDHIRDGHRQHVTDWHASTLENLGWRHVSTETVPVGNGNGRHHNAQTIDSETIAVFETRDGEARHGA